MQEHTLADENIITIPELHPEKMHFMPPAGKPFGKFPDTFFNTTFYVGIDDIVDKSDLHPANLYIIVVLIEEHHTLEHGEKKHLYPGNYQDKGNNRSGDF